MAQIECVIPRAGHRLEVQFTNGTIIVLNLAERIHTVRFGLLADEGFFRRAVTDGDFVRWANKIEISATELFQLAQK